MNSSLYLHGLNLIPGIGLRTQYKLLEHYENDPKKVWQASKSDLKLFLNTNSLNTFLEHRNKIDLEEENKNLSKNNITLLNYLDELYPDYLKNIYLYPLLLYCKGDLSLLKHQFLLAVVGSRKPSSYGFRVTQLFTEKLCENGFVIVSGMARGIDSLAHNICIKLKRPTIAVLGSGVDVIYPRENHKMYKEIINTGLVISEFPLGTPPNAPNFPRRNRIISGLGKGVLVVEAAAKSGSLITADLALEQGKDVFAIPGDIFSYNSEGTNRLIKQGAKIVTTINDIIEEYNMIEQLTFFDADRNLDLKPAETKVLGCFEREYYLSFEKIQAATEIQTSALLGILTSLELKGLLKKDYAQNYMLI